MVVRLRGQEHLEHGADEGVLLDLPVSGRHGLRLPHQEVVDTGADHPHPARAKGLVGLSILLIDWSAVSSLRMLDEGHVAATMFEELFMFGLTVVIVLWSRTGSRFSQERLAMVLSLGFAYVIAYAGSISSISVSSDLNVAGVLGVGHALTAIVMALFVIPAVRRLRVVEANSLLSEKAL